MVAVAAPFPHNINVFIGDSWPPGPNRQAVVTVTDGPDRDNQSPLSLEGYTVMSNVKRRRGFSAVDAALDLEILDQDTNTGQIGVRLPSDQSALLDPGDYMWDLRIQFDSDDAVVLVTGHLHAYKPVSTFP